MHCTDVRVLLEGLCAERRLDLKYCMVGIGIDFGKWFLKFILTLFEYQSCASSPEGLFLLSARMQSYILIFTRLVEDVVSKCMSLEKRFKTRQPILVA